MSSAYVAELRRRRRAAGQKETTVWLSKEADEFISRLVEQKGLRNRSEAVQYVVSKVAEQESSLSI